MAAKKDTSAISQKDIEEIFSLFNKDKNGLVSERDLALVLRRFGNPTDAEIKNLLDQMGVKKGQKIDFKQFSKLIETQYNTGTDIEENLKDAFKQFDKDKNGTIDKKELKTVLVSIGEKLTDAEVSEMMDRVDTNNDGKIQYNEFVKIFTHGLR